MKKSLLVLSLIGSAALAMAADTPVFQFKMNEGEGDVIKSTGSNTASVKIKRTNFEWIPGRKGGKALSFKYTGNPKVGEYSCAVVPAARSIDFTKPFSITFWFKLDKDILGNTQYTVIGNAKTDRGPGWRVIYAWGKLSFTTAQGKAGTSKSVNVDPAKFPYKKDVWHHLAITYDGTKCAVYLNGIKAGEQELTVSEGKTNLTIGAYAEGYAYGFRGAFSDLAIYDKVIEEDAILAEAQGIN